MSETFDLLVQHARLRRRPGALYDIAVQGGCIELIEESPGVSAAVVVDAAGGLVTEPFVTRTCTSTRSTPCSRCMKTPPRCEAYHGAARWVQRDDMPSRHAVPGEGEMALVRLRRNRRGLDQGERAPGPGASRRRGLRQHPHPRLRRRRLESEAWIGVEAVLAGPGGIQRGSSTLQVVAFPQDGVVREPGHHRPRPPGDGRSAPTSSEEFPGSSYTEADEQRHTTCGRCSTSPWPFTTADVSMLVDDAGDPGLRTLEKLAVKRDRGSVGQDRCLAHHARAMESVSGAVLPQKLVALLKTGPTWGW